MNDMNEKDIIRCFADIAKYDLSDERVEKDISRTREKLKGDAAARSQRKPIWRIIMTSKWTQLSSAAAVVIVALVIGANLFSNPRLEAADLLAQVARNMDNLAWIKFTTENYLPDQNEPVSIDVEWTDVENKRVFMIFDDTYIHELDYNLVRKRVYRPDSNDMIVEPLAGTWTSPGAGIEPLIEQLRNEGLDVKRSERTEAGRTFTILQCVEVLNDLPAVEPPITAMSMNGRYVKTMRSEIAIDTSRYMLGSSTTTYLDRTGDVIVIKRSQFEPVTTGPADIYELGVPRDVTIIDRMPSQTVSQTRERIDANRARFLDEYIAVITKADVEDGQEDITEAFVVYCQGKNLRVDVFRKNYGPSDRLAERYRAQLEPTLHYLIPYWPERNQRDIQAVRLYDGLWQYVLEADEGRLVARERQRRPDGDLYGDDDIDDFAWRQIWWLNRPEHMYEDSYSQENGLIAMELTAQAQGSQPPRRFVLYVDPEKGYLCNRYIEQRLFDAPWQEDKNWVASKSSLAEFVRDTRMIEYGYTKSVQWYPTVIMETGYTQEYEYVRTETNRIIRIHLVAEHPEFPEGIFDPSRLPSPSN